MGLTSKNHFESNCIFFQLQSWFRNHALKFVDPCQEQRSLSSPTSDRNSLSSHNPLKSVGGNRLKRRVATLNGHAPTSRASRKQVARFAKFSVRCRPPRDSRNRTSGKWRTATPQDSCASFAFLSQRSFRSVSKRSFLTLFISDKQPHFHLNSFHRKDTCLIFGKFHYRAKMIRNRLKFWCLIVRFQASKIKDNWEQFLLKLDCLLK